MARKKKTQTGVSDSEYVNAGKGRVGLRNLKKEHFWCSRKRQVITVVGALVLIFIVIAAVPQLRYGVAGNFVKRDVTVMVADALTKRPVSEATVYIGTQTARTDAEGKAIVRAVPAGEYTAKIEKSHYALSKSSYTVPLWGDVVKLETTLTATGRQVPVSVVNKISKVALAGVKLTVGDTSAVTDGKGIATIVLPVGEEKLNGTLELKDYNKVSVEIAVTEEADSNKFFITPYGSIFFLSNKSGDINLVSTDLDGSNRKVIVKATGNEQKEDTEYLVSTDQRYVALKAKRAAHISKQLYLVDIKTSKLSVIESGDIDDIHMGGWSGYHFVYRVDRKGKNIKKDFVLKSFNAESRQLSTLHEATTPLEPIYFYIIDEEVIYFDEQGAGVSFDSIQLRSIKLDGGGSREVKKFDKKGKGNFYVDHRHYKSGELQIRERRYHSGNWLSTFYVYEKGMIKQVGSINNYTFEDTYPIFYESPSAEYTFWQELRDGKNSLFIADKDGDSDKAIAESSEYSAFGWYSDKYILMSKNGSELYVAAVDSSFKDTQPLKITDYYYYNNDYFQRGDNSNCSGCNI